MCIVKKNNITVEMLISISIDRKFTTMFCRNYGDDFFKMLKVISALKNLKLVSKNAYPKKQFDQCCQHAIASLHVEFLTTSFEGI